MCPQTQTLSNSEVIIKNVTKKRRRRTHGRPALDAEIRIEEADEVRRRDRERCAGELNVTRGDVESEH